MVDASKVKILVVDDSKTHLMFAQGALEGAGWEVGMQGSPVGTVVRVLREQPDLLLMDVNMPGLSGTSVASIIKKGPRTQRTRVVLYSDIPELELAVRAKECEADGFITKSVDRATLVSKVQRYLDVPVAGA